jgi:murein L,D-transpeptidase YcbB/YkuD
MVRQSVAVALVSLLGGCAGWNGMSHQAKATTDGATGGAIVGAAVGGPVGAAVGAGVGGVVAHNNSEQVPTFNAPAPNENRTAQNSASNDHANTSSYNSSSSSTAMPANEPNDADRARSANATEGSASNTNAMVQNNTTDATGNNAQSGNEAQDHSLVRDAQRALNDKGFSAGATDGVMGPHTESALRQFQQAQGLSTTGTLDQQTISALGISQ